MIQLAGEGVRTVAPSMRGYGGTPNTKGGVLEIADLAWDTVCLTWEMGLEEPLLIGHDVGALAAYAAANMEPRRFSRIVMMGFPPLPVFRRNITMVPRQLRTSWYMFYFQFPFVTENAFSNNPRKVIEKLWRDWSPRWRFPETRLASVLETMARPGTAQATADCCRGIVRMTSFQRPEMRETRRLLTKPIRGHAMLLAGQEDGCFGPWIFNGAERFFQGAYRFELIDSCGHFLHQEHPEQVGAKILEFAGLETKPLSSDSDPFREKSSPQGRFAGKTEG